MRRRLGDDCENINGSNRNPLTERPPIVPLDSTIDCDSCGTFLFVGQVYTVVDSTGSEISVCGNCCATKYR